MTMTTATTPSASQTTTAGCRSSESPDLASLILAAAAESAAQRPTGWRAKLNDEQRGVIDDIKRRWLATRASTGMSASHLARAIVDHMVDCKLPKPKHIAQWLTSPHQ
jgi:hypothetical protein